MNCKTCANHRACGMLGECFLQRTGCPVSENDRLNIKVLKDTEGGLPVWGYYVGFDLRTTIETDKKENTSRAEGTYVKKAKHTKAKLLKIAEVIAKHGRSPKKEKPQLSSEERVAAMVARKAEKQRRKDLAWQEEVCKKYEPKTKTIEDYLNEPEPNFHEDQQ